MLQTLPNYIGRLLNGDFFVSNKVIYIMAIVKLRDFTTAPTFAVTHRRASGFNNPVMCALLLLGNSTVIFHSFSFSLFLMKVIYRNEGSKERVFK